MIITLFEGQRTETYNSLSEAASAAKNWYPDLEEEKRPPWDYKIQTFGGLLAAIEANNRRIASALANDGDCYQRPRLAAVGIE
jgi:hypothetical protein